MFKFNEKLMCSSAFTPTNYCYHQAEKESGRSMTEMLGVLAVIGVLSVGGIAGYRYAMDKHYTNELLAGASERAVLVAAQITAGRQVSLKEFDKIETAGGKFDGTIKRWDGEFGIQVTKVNESVCKNLIKATEDTDIILAKTDDSDLTESDCSSDENTFLFVYSNDMGAVDFVFDEDDEGCVGEDCPNAIRYECHSGYIWKWEKNEWGYEQGNTFSVCPTGYECNEGTNYYAETCKAGCISALCKDPNDSDSNVYYYCDSGCVKRHDPQATTEDCFTSCDCTHGATADLWQPLCASGGNGAYCSSDMNLYFCTSGVCTNGGLNCPCPGFWTENNSSHICTMSTPSYYCGAHGDYCYQCHSGVVWICSSEWCLDWEDPCDCEGVWGFSPVYDKLCPQKLPPSSGYLCKDNRLYNLNGDEPMDCACTTDAIGQTPEDVCDYGLKFVCRDGEHVDQYENGILIPNEGCNYTCQTGEVRGPSDDPWCWR